LAAVQRQFLQHFIGGGRFTRKDTLGEGQFMNSVGVLLASGDGDEAVTARAAVVIEMSGWDSEEKKLKNSWEADSKRGCFFRYT
jgi:hypothetical protein